MTKEAPRVMIVDDEPSVREVVTRWLAAGGYDAAQAASAEDAVEAMTRRPAEVVLCDIRMPGRGGLWLVSELRARYPETALILATAVDSVAPGVSLQEGVVGYLVKPFGRERLLRAVRRGLTWRAESAARSAGARPSKKAVGDWLDELPE